MSGALEGKVALVTGAGQGVGRGIALALAKRGARVALAGRTKAKLDDVAGQIEAFAPHPFVSSEVETRSTAPRSLDFAREERSEGKRAVALACDVKDAASVTDTVERAARELGGVDILVNNAQEVPLGPLMDVTDAAFEAGFDSGPLATFRFMKAAHPHMKARGGGVIFNLASSAAVRWDMANYGAYAAVKQAIRSLSRAAAAEWGIDGIRVLTIAPHARSPSLAWWIENNPEEAKAFFRTIPLRRVGDCEADIGEAVAGLCGPEFAYLTGATIPLDGGQANFD